MVFFGEKLRMLRKGRNITQQTLAVQVGVTVSAISAYESGSRYPSYEVLLSLARIFHVSTDYLLGLEKNRCLDVTGLSEREIDILAKTIEIFRDKSV
ncbi:helix-turn-helix domain-containing protein [Blautia schinkii]|nr:helix-turn-helix domain-containing protein [Blautia schinkii]